MATRLNLLEWQLTFKKISGEEARIRGEEVKIIVVATKIFKNSLEWQLTFKKIGKKENI